MLFVVIRGAFLLILHIILNYIIFEILLDKLQQIVACLFLYIGRLIENKTRRKIRCSTKIRDERDFVCNIEKFEVDKILIWRKGRDKRLTIIKIKNDEISDIKNFENRRFNCEIKWNYIENIKVKSESNKIFSNIGKFNCEKGKIILKLLKIKVKEIKLKCLIVKL